jgi:hypothetical protein
LIALSIAITPAGASPTPSASEKEAIDRLIAPSLAALKAGKSREAVDIFLGSNELMASKRSDVAFLASQIDSMIGIYGPISDCQLSETRNNGAVVEQRLYHCQHRNFVTRWIFLAVKTTGGWTGGNLSFDDKLMNSLRE